MGGGDIKTERRSFLCSKHRQLLKKMSLCEFLCWFSVYVSWNPWTPAGNGKDTGLRHHPEDQSGITRKMSGSWISFSFFSSRSHSSARSLLKSQQWSPDGAAKAGLIHVLLIQARGWRNEEVQGRSHQRNHHNSGVWHADNWLMAAINPDQEKRGYYICCGGEWCVALWKLERSEGGTMLLTS